MYTELFTPLNKSGIQNAVPSRVIVGTSGSARPRADSSEVLGLLLLFLISNFGTIDYLTLGYIPKLLCLK